MTRKLFACSLILVMLLVSSSSLFAETVIKISHQGAGDPEINIQSYFVKEFTERAEKKTNGTVKFEVYPDEQLGSEEQRMELIMKDGLNQPVADISSFNALGTVLSELCPSAIPFMFNSYESAHIFFDTSE